MTKEKTKLEREAELRALYYKRMADRHARVRAAPMDKIRQKALTDIKIKEELEREFPSKEEK